MTDVVCFKCGKISKNATDTVRCYDCGMAYCRRCIGPNWMGACPDCLEVFTAEEDYWDRE